MVEETFTLDLIRAKLNTLETLEEKESYLEKLAEELKGSKLLPEILKLLNGIRNSIKAQKDLEERIKEATGTDEVKDSAEDAPDYQKYRIGNTEKEELEEIVPKPDWQQPAIKYERQIPLLFINYENPKQAKDKLLNYLGDIDAMHRKEELLDVVGIATGTNDPAKKQQYLNELIERQHEINKYKL